MNSRAQRYATSTMNENLEKISLRGARTWKWNQNTAVESRQANNEMPRGETLMQTTGSAGNVNSFPSPPIVLQIPLPQRFELLWMYVRQIVSRISKLELRSLSFFVLSTFFTCHLYCYSCDYFYSSSTQFRGSRSSPPSSVGPLRFGIHNFPQSFILSSFVVRPRCRRRRYVGMFVLIEIVPFCSSSKWNFLLDFHRKCCAHEWKFSST